LPNLQSPINVIDPLTAWIVSNHTQKLGSMHMQPIGLPQRINWSLIVTILNHHIKCPVWW